MESIIQNHSEIPPEYLVAAGPGLYKRGIDGEDKDVDSVWSGTYHEEGALIYDEWDHSREHHRKGWINDAEREALILLAEALDSLSDRFAIYGFSGWTRKCCEAYPIKTFDQAYDAQTKGRIYTLVSDVTKLPMKVSDIYRKLTS